MAKAEKKQVSLEAGLWNACNKLRGSVTATDYVNVVLGLLFLRFAYDKFNAQREKLLADETIVNPFLGDFRRFRETVVEVDAEEWGMDEYGEGGAGLHRAGLCPEVP